MRRAYTKALRSCADGDTDAPIRLKVGNTIVAVCKTIWCKTSCWLAQVLNRASLTLFPTTSLAALPPPSPSSSSLAARRAFFLPFFYTAAAPFIHLPLLLFPFSRPVDRLALAGGFCAVYASSRTRARNLLSRPAITGAPQTPSLTPQTRDVRQMNSLVFTYPRESTSRSLDRTRPFLLKSARLLGRSRSRSIRKKKPPDRDTEFVASSRNRGLSKEEKKNPSVKKA